MAATKKLSGAKKARVLAQIAQLHLEGRTQSEIAQELSTQEEPFKQQMVSYYLKEVEKVWLTEAKLDVEKARARELAKVNHLERTYWDAWRKSLDPMKQKKSQKAQGDAGNKESAEIKEFSSIGEKKYLEGVQWCIERRAKLLGLDAPTKISGFLGSFDARKVEDMEKLERIASGEDPLIVLASAAERKN